jgi:hypothetical protein
MTRVIVARIYVDKSTEYLPPSDAVHPPAAGELRVTIEDEGAHHLELFKGQEWTDLGEVTNKLLETYGLDPFTSF